MSILNRTSDGLLSVLIALRRAILAYGPMPQEKLLALCAPSSLAHHGEAFKEQKQARQTLTRWLQIGLFTLDDQERIALRDGFDVPEDDLSTFRAALRTLVLSPANSVESREGHPPPTADFTRALSWAMAQDVFQLPGGAWEEVEHIEMAQFTSEPFAFQNKTRWNGFRDWAPFLGFGWTVWRGRSTIYFVDPTEAVRHSLDAVFGDAPEMAVVTFLDTLRNILPVTDGGKYRTAVEERLGNTWTPPRAHEISTSLSRALLNLEISGQLRLDRRADAEQRTLLGGNRRAVLQISHLVKTGKN